MSSKKEIILVTVSAVLYTVLFHNNPLGINLLIFELFVVLSLLISRQFRLKGTALIVSAAGLLTTAIATVLVFSAWAIFVNIIMFLLFVGCLVFPEVKSLFHAFNLFFCSAFYSIAVFFKKLSDTSFKGRNLGVYLKKISIFLIPLAIIIVFISIYRYSNPVFDKIMVRIGDAIYDFLVMIFGRFDWQVILTFFLGLFFCTVIFFRSPYQWLIERYRLKTDFFRRIKVRAKRKFPILGLKNEYKAGVFLFLVLNLTLLVVNVIDIQWVWFNFEWNGQFLKQFVHNGTYLLILSILISVALVLYYFRGKLNFYKKNTFLKYLSYAWLLQNAVLAISVAIRNYWYIYYFSLAYKRIGVYMFLILTIYGLYTVLVKVKYSKSAFYVIRQNAYSLFIVLVLSSVFNWDCIIARYNFNNYKRSFVHLNYLSKLSDKALPYLDKPQEELNYIDSVQKGKFPFHFLYMSHDEYFNRIEMRKKKFKTKWESKGILSWNYPEYKAYKVLFGKK